MKLFEQDVNEFYLSMHRRVINEVDAIPIEELRGADAEGWCASIAARHRIEPPRLEVDARTFDQEPITLEGGPLPRPGHRITVFLPVGGSSSVLAYKAASYADLWWHATVRWDGRGMIRLVYSAESSDPGRLKATIEEDVGRLERGVDACATRARSWNESIPSRVRERVESRLAQAREIDWESALGMPRRKPGEAGEGGGR